MMIATATDKSVRIRFPKGMREQIRARARKSGRSFNSEVLVRLAMTLEAKRK